MSLPSRPHPAHVPTLTEVIELPDVLDAPAASLEVNQLAALPPGAELPELTEVPDLASVLDPLQQAAPADGLGLAQVPDLTAVPELTDIAEVPELSASPVRTVGPQDVPSAPPLAAPPEVSPVNPLADQAVEQELVGLPEPQLPVTESQLSQRVLADVQRQIDSMLEFRLRESMQPLLAQFTETLMQDLRDELSRTMRDVVTRAVAQEMAKLRNR